MNENPKEDIVLWIKMVHQRSCGFGLGSHEHTILLTFYVNSYGV